jgi:hypothetical protein
MSSHLRLRFAGPDRYCPDCKRLLVHVHEDGTFDLAAKAALITEGEVGPEDFDAGEAELLAVDATCLSRRCRFRRWLRDLGT